MPCSRSGSFHAPGLAYCWSCALRLMQLLGLLLFGRRLLATGVEPGGRDDTGFAADAQRWMYGARIRATARFARVEDGGAEEHTYHRGVFATRDLPAGWSVARVPMSAFVNIEHVLADQALGAEIRDAERRLGYDVYEPAAVGAFLARSSASASASAPASASASSSPHSYAVQFAKYARWLARSNVEGSPAMWRDDGNADNDAKACAANGDDEGPPWPLPSLKDWLSGTSLLRETRAWQASLHENWREWGRTAWMRTVVNVQESSPMPSPSSSSSSLSSSSSSSSSAAAAAAAASHPANCQYRQQFMFWAQVVQSRVHTISVRDRDGSWVTTKCMVPVADAINTGPPADLNVRCFTNDASTHFVCKTLTPVIAGSELLTAYAGSGRSLGRYLLQYGFAPPWMMRSPQSPGDNGGGGSGGGASSFSADAVWIEVGINRVSEKISSRKDVDRLLAKWGAATILPGVERALSALKAGGKREEFEFVKVKEEKEEGTNIQNYERVRAACRMVRAAERAQLERVQRYILEFERPASEL